MIPVDANLLIYASDGDSPHHAKAHGWLDKLNGSARVGRPWTCLLAFMRVVTNPRVMSRPATVTAARSKVRPWLECDSAPADRLGR